jgi:hypothetical protein
MGAIQMVLGGLVQFYTEWPSGRAPCNGQKLFDVSAVAIVTLRADYSKDTAPEHHSEPPPFGGVAWSPYGGSASGACDARSSKGWCDASHGTPAAPEHLKPFASYVHGRDSLRGSWLLGASAELQPYPEINGAGSCGKL